MSKSKKRSGLYTILDDLNNALETPQHTELVEGPPIQIIDLSLAYNHMFSAAAKRGLMRKVKERTPIRDVGFPQTLSPIRDQVEYFSVRAMGQEKIVKAARMLAEAMNAYAAEGFITGHLSPLSVVQLVTQPHMIEHYAVFIFPVLTELGIKKAANDPLRIPEGDCTKAIVA